MEHPTPASNSLLLPPEDRKTAPHDDKPKATSASGTAAGAKHAGVDANVYGSVAIGSDGKIDWSAGAPGSERQLVIWAVPQLLRLLVWARVGFNRSATLQKINPWAVQPESLAPSSNETAASDDSSSTAGAAVKRTSSDSRSLLPLLAQRFLAAVDAATKAGVMVASQSPPREVMIALFQLSFCGLASAMAHVSPRRDMHTAFALHASLLLHLPPSRSVVVIGSSNSGGGDGAQQRVEGLAANGGGRCVNMYTVIMTVKLDRLPGGGRLGCAGDDEADFDDDDMDDDDNDGSFERFVLFTPHPYSLTTPQSRALALAATGAAGDIGSGYGGDTSVSISANLSNSANIALTTAMNLLTVDRFGRVRIGYTGLPPVAAATAATVATAARARMIAQSQAQAQLSRAQQQQQQQQQQQRGGGGASAGGGLRRPMPSPTTPVISAGLSTAPGIATPQQPLDAEDVAAVESDSNDIESLAAASAFDYDPVYETEYGAGLLKSKAQYIAAVQNQAVALDKSQTTLATRSRGTRPPLPTPVAATARQQHQRQQDQSLSSQQQQVMQQLTQQQCLRAPQALWKHSNGVKTAGLNGDTNSGLRSNSSTSSGLPTAPPPSMATTPTPSFNVHLDANNGSDRSGHNALPEVSAHTSPLGTSATDESAYPSDLVDVGIQSKLVPTVGTGRWHHSSLLNDSPTPTPKTTAKTAKRASVKWRMHGDGAVSSDNVAETEHPFSFFTRSPDDNDSDAPSHGTAATTVVAPPSQPHSRSRSQSQYQPQTQSHQQRDFADLAQASSRSLLPSPVSRELSDAGAHEPGRDGYRSTDLQASHGHADGDALSVLSVSNAPPQTPASANSPHRTAAAKTSAQIDEGTLYTVGEGNLFLPDELLDLPPPFQFEWQHSPGSSAATSVENKSGSGQTQMQPSPVLRQPLLQSTRPLRSLLNPISLPPMSPSTSLPTALHAQSQSQSQPHSVPQSETTSPDRLSTTAQLHSSHNLSSSSLLPRSRSLWPWPLQPNAQPHSQSRVQSPSDTQSHVTNAGIKSNGANMKKDTPSSLVYSNSMHEVSDIGDMYAPNSVFTWHTQINPDMPEHSQANTPAVTTARNGRRGSAEPGKRGASVLQKQQRPNHAQSHSVGHEEEEEEDGGGAHSASTSPIASPLATSPEIEIELERGQEHEQDHGYQCQCDTNKRKGAPCVTTGPTPASTPVPSISSASHLLTETINFEGPTVRDATQLPPGSGAGQIPSVTDVSQIPTVSSSSLTPTVPDATQTVADKHEGEMLGLSHFDWAQPMKSSYLRRLSSAGVGVGAPNVGPRPANANNRCSYCHGTCAPAAADSDAGAGTQTQPNVKQAGNDETARENGAKVDSDSTSTSGSVISGRYSEKSAVIASTPRGGVFMTPFSLAHSPLRGRHHPQYHSRGYGQGHSHNNIYSQSHVPSPAQQQQRHQSNANAVAPVPIAGIASPDVDVGDTPVGREQPGQALTPSMDSASVSMSSPPNSFASTPPLRDGVRDGMRDGVRGTARGAVRCGARSDCPLPASASQSQQLQQTQQQHQQQPQQAQQPQQQQQRPQAPQEQGPSRDQHGQGPQQPPTQPAKPPATGPDRTNGSHGNGNHGSNGNSKKQSVPAAPSSPPSPPSPPRPPVILPGRWHVVALTVNTLQSVAIAYVDGVRVDHAVLPSSHNAVTYTTTSVNPKATAGANNVQATTTNSNADAPASAALGSVGVDCCGNSSTAAPAVSTSALPAVAANRRSVTVTVTNVSASSSTGVDGVYALSAVCGIGGLRGRGTSSSRDSEELGGARECQCKCHDLKHSGTTAKAPCACECSAGGSNNNNSMWRLKSVEVLDRVVRSNKLSRMGKEASHALSHQ